MGELLKSRGVSVESCRVRIDNLGPIKFGIVILTALKRKPILFQPSLFPLLYPFPPLTPHTYNSGWIKWQQDSKYSVFSCRDIDISLLRPDNDKWNTDGAGLSWAGPHPSPSLSLAYWDLYCAVMHCTHTRVSLSRSRWYQAEVR